jgi:hypothetical protein
MHGALRLLDSTVAHNVGLIASVSHNGCSRIDIYLRHLTRDRGSV